MPHSTDNDNEKNQIRTLPKVSIGLLEIQTPSVAALKMVRNKEIVGHVSGHSLAEAYAVLTLTPFTPPIYPAEAWKLLSENVLSFFQIVPLTPAMYREAIQECSESGWLVDLKTF
jgi:hypothetical protein